MRCLTLLFIILLMCLLLLRHGWILLLRIVRFFLPINIVRNDRNRRGGGIAFLLSPRVKFVLRPDLCEGKIESIWIELYPSTKRSVLFCCAYRPPSQHNFFDHLLAECESAYSHCP